MSGGAYRNPERLRERPVRSDEPTPFTGEPGRDAAPPNNEERRVELLLVVIPAREGFAVEIELQLKLDDFPAVE